MFHQSTFATLACSAAMTSYLVLAAPGVLPRNGCDGTSVLNATYPTIESTYTVKENETMTAIAASLGVGICDIARANRMADAMLVYTGEQLNIPSASSCPDDTSCLIPTNANATNTCVMGGPHVYTTFDGDTLRSIANDKFNISLTALQGTAMGPGVNDPDTNLGANNGLKLPLCKESECTVLPYEIQYGTYADVALAYGSTVGQIMAMNPTYNKSTGAAGDGPVVAILAGCKLTTDGTPTVIS